jgi:hypothetical protein
MPRIFIVKPAGEEPQLYVGQHYVTSQENFTHADRFTEAIADLSSALGVKPVEVFVPIDHDIEDCIAQVRVPATLKATFSANGGTATDLRHRDGQPFTLVGIDPEFEKPEPGTPPMWLIRFPDGEQASVHEDEICDLS